MNIGIGLGLTSLRSAGLSSLFSSGQPGHWPDSYDPARGLLFQDAAGTIPVTAPGQPVGLVKRAGGTADASQGTALSRPTLGRWPRGGRRNLLTWSEDFSNAVWSKINATVSGSTLTATGSSNSARVQQSFSATSGQQRVATFTVSAGTSDRTAIRVLNSGNSIYARADLDWTASVPTVSISTGADAVTIKDTGGGSYDVTVIFTPSETATQNIAYYIDTSGLNRTAILSRTQLETGPTATPYQRVTTAFDITETGKPDVWHLYSDGGDSLPVTLPAGTYGRARVNTEGVVTVDTVVDPTDALSGTRQVDVILRQGAFTAGEEAQIRAYWARYAP